MSGNPGVDLDLDGPELSGHVEQRFNQSDPGRFLSIELPENFDPVVLLDDPVASGVVGSYERPDREFALVAVGETERVEFPPNFGAADVPRYAERMLSPGTDSDAPHLRPRLLCGFSFRSDVSPGPPWSEFGCGALLMPQLLFVRDGGKSGIVVSPGADVSDVMRILGNIGSRTPDTSQSSSVEILRDVDRERWLSSVEAISSEVRDGLYEKAVLATSLEIGGVAEIGVGGALARLRRGYPHCHLFSFTFGHATFMGASPELLVALESGSVTALGLAGSSGRGATGDEDRLLGRALLESAKNRIEHETVVRAIREALRGVTSSLRAPNQPKLRRLRNIQHLSTEISGQALSGVGVLDLVQRLHPTPAVCGWPTDVALDVIEAHEDFERGWYAGPIGWLDSKGDGEFAVALRSALVRGSRAWLFAGNGIMGDSDPAAELAEVELKFSPLAEALGSTPV